MRALHFDSHAGDEVGSWLWSEPAADNMGLSFEPRFAIQFCNHREAGLRSISGQFACAAATQWQFPSPQRAARDKDCVNSWSFCKGIPLYREPTEVSRLLGNRGPRVDIGTW